jgi:2-oxo-4-hydroxy-4-carboxy-5-ureidoimidazoline decarboxylase
MGRSTGSVHEALSTFNALPAAEARHALLACCASVAWAGTVAAGRPYEDLDALLAASDATVRDLDWADVAEALAAHPRIGERVAAAGGGGGHAGWSHREQSGVATAGAEAREALAAGNAEYERRFGHIYLVRAAGRSADELLALLYARLGNDEATERAVVRRELAEITGRRLAGQYGGDAGGAGTAVAR